METSNVTGNRIKEYMSQGKRFDGRSLDEFREISIETGVSNKAEGSARVRLGKTEVIVGVKLGVTSPYQDSPNKGNLMVTSELLPLSSPRIESGPPKFPAIELGRLVDRAIREGKYIDFEKLCIKEGEKVWQVFIDVYSINHDGNLLDAASIGAIAALKSAVFPKYDEEKEEIVYGEFTDKKIPLSKEVPIVTTIYKIGDNIVADPTLEEEDLGDARVTIGATAEGAIFSMQKGFSAGITSEEMKKILEVSEKARKSVAEKINKLLK